MGDMAALVAPRPLYIEVGTEDSLNGDRGLIGVREQVDRAKKFIKCLMKMLSIKNVKDIISGLVLVMIG